MKDHIHIVWETTKDTQINDLITSFKKFTGYQIKKYLSKIDPNYLESFMSERADRSFKIWNIPIGNINIHGFKMLQIKVNYIHNNPTKAHYKVVDDSIDYYFSSAKAYYYQKTNFEFLVLLEDLLLR